jgi:hypothetical protein
MADAGRRWAGDDMVCVGVKMKVATQSCRPFKVAKLAKFANETKSAKRKENRCNFKVASRKLLQVPPF